MTTTERDGVETGLLAMRRGTLQGRRTELRLRGFRLRLELAEQWERFFVAPDGLPRVRVSREIDRIEGEQRDTERGLLETAARLGALEVGT